MFQTFGIRKAVMALSLKGGSAVIGFLMNLLVVKILSIEESGGFFLSLAIIYIANIVAQLGLDQTLTRFFSREQSASDESMGVYITSIIIITCSSTLLSAALYLSSHWLSNDIFNDSSLYSILPIMCLAIAPYSIQWLNAHILQGLGKVNLFHVFQNILVNTAFLVIVALGHFLLSIRFSITELAITFLFSVIASSILSIFTCS